MVALNTKLARLAEWFAALQGRAGELLDQRLGADCLGGLEQVALTLEQVTQSRVAPEETLLTLDDDESRHPLSRTRWRTTLEQEILEISNREQRRLGPVHRTRHP